MKYLVLSLLLLAAATFSANVTGTVKDGSGNNIDGALVVLATGTMAGDSSELTFLDTAFSAEGAYAFNDVQAVSGEILIVSVLKAGYQSVTKAKLFLGMNTQVNITLVPVDTSLNHSLSGTITDSAGAPVQGAVVGLLVGEIDPSALFTGATLPLMIVMTDAQGQYLITGIPDSVTSAIVFVSDPVLGATGDSISLLAGANVYNHAFIPNDPAVEASLAAMQAPFAVAPNPSMNGSRVFIQGTLSGSMHVTLFSADGRLLSSFDGKAGSPLPTAGLAAGVYLVKVQAGKNNYITRLTLTR